MLLVKQSHEDCVLCQLGVNFTELLEGTFIFHLFCFKQAGTWSGANNVLISEKRGETRVLDHVQQFLKYLTVGDVEKHSRCDICFCIKSDSLLWQKISKRYVKIVFWEAAGYLLGFFVAFLFCFVFFFHSFNIQRQKSKIVNKAQTSTPAWLKKNSRYRSDIIKLVRKLHSLSTTWKGLETDSLKWNLSV